MHGQCLCGQVSFAIDAPLLKLYRCHCSLCRRHTGTAANCAAIVDAACFRWLTGDGLIASWNKATGYRSDFCRSCGSPVPHRLTLRDAYWVPAGLLDDSAALSVVADFHLDSRAAWDNAATAAASFANFPAIEEFFALMHTPAPTSE